MSSGRLAQRSAVKMGSSNSEAGDEDYISDGVKSDVDVVVVNLADASLQPWPTNASMPVGNFPGCTPMGGQRAIPWHRRGNASVATAKNGFRARPTAMVGRPISPASTVFPRHFCTNDPEASVLSKSCHSHIRECCC